MAGQLIVFEGPDGVGKSRLASEIATMLHRRDIATIQVSFPGNDDNTLGRLIYDLHHHHRERFQIQAVNPLSMQMLHVAAHIDQIDTVVRPAIGRGTWVVLNRFWWSTWVYGKAAGINEQYLNLVTEVEKRYWGDLLPAAIFLVKRRTPIRREHAQEQFEHLSDLYSKLALRERASSTVHEIENVEVPVSVQSIEAALRAKIL